MTVTIRNLLAGTALGLALACTPAHALPFFEGSDAGDLPATAKIISSNNLIALDLIAGHLDFDLNTMLWDIDLYAIQITDPFAFSARTEIGDPNEIVSDPVLFLFGFDGRGIYMNDDTSLSPVNLQSTLPAGAVNGPMGAGLYYLAVAWSFSDPMSIGGSIFPLYEFLSTLPSDGVYGPTGRGGALPLASWVPDGPTNSDVGADYRILLTGTTFLLPEPGTLGLLALVGLGFLVRRRLTP